MRFIGFVTRGAFAVFGLGVAAAAGCSALNAPDDVKAGPGNGSGGAGGAGGSTTSTTTTSTTSTSTTSTTSAGGGGPVCADGVADCDGNPATPCDPLDTIAHCGACDTSCVAADMHAATALCTASACDYDACAAGFADCDQDRANGCETSLDAMANCGACGVVCAPANADGATCDGGSCAYAGCTPGFYDLDGDPTNGCEIALRPNLMRCGSSQRDVATLLPPGVQLNVVAGCVPDANTQAILVTRNFGNALSAGLFQSYLAGGGIALTEYGISDEVYSLAFGSTAQGAGQGGCQDTAPTVAQFSPNDPFWAANPYMPAMETGCGYSVGGFPGIVPLAGWDAQNVAIGYRDSGAGRLWVTDFDWQDGDTVGADFAYTASLMGYMITHSK